MLPISKKPATALAIAGFLKSWSYSLGDSSRDARMHEARRGQVSNGRLLTAFNYLHHGLHLIMTWIVNTMFRSLSTAANAKTRARQLLGPERLCWVSGRRICLRVIPVVSELQGQVGGEPATQHGRGLSGLSRSRRGSGCSRGYASCRVSGRHLDREDAGVVGPAAAAEQAAQGFERHSPAGRNAHGAMPETLR